jgi:hypothetical protein
MQQLLATSLSQHIVASSEVSIDRWQSLEYDRAGHEWRTRKPM